MKWDAEINSRITHTYIGLNIIKRLQNPKFVCLIYFFDLMEPFLFFQYKCVLIVWQFINEKHLMGKSWPLMFFLPFWTEIPFSFPNWDRSLVGFLSATKNSAKQISNIFEQFFDHNILEILELVWLCYEWSVWIILFVHI